MKWFIVLTASVMIISFQNCAPRFNFADSEGSVENSSFSDTTLIETQMNTPIDFQLESSREFTVKSIQFEETGAPLQGQFSIQEANQLKLKYAPAFGFRGREEVMAVVTDKFENKIRLHIIATVGNALSHFEPALAVRGMGCIQCHASISSNIVTDFGYGNKYFFGENTPLADAWKSGSIYGDHGQNFGTMVIPSKQTVYVPAATLPSVVQKGTGYTKLAQYVSGKLKASEYSSTKAVAVKEMSKVYIGAPTEAQMVSSLKLAARERMKFYKNSITSPALSGLKDQGDFFEASGSLVCDGDLVVRGPLYLENLKIQTQMGCRLYVIGSVFLYGEIQYADSQALNNLQITSTKSINLGLGSVLDSKGVNCDSKDGFSANPKEYGTSTLVNRYQSFWTVPGNFVRQNESVKSFGDSVVAEAKLIEAKKGTLKDAVCRTEKRAVSFEHLLLNAPVIHSRYAGDFKGTVIAELSIMTLGAFVFEFDPIFKEVPVWPFLDSSTYFHVE